MRVNRFLSSIVAVAIVLGVACGSDEAPAATVAPAISPATVTPFIPATIASVADVSPIEAGLLGLGKQRVFPESLMQESVRLPGDEAAALWAEYLGDSRVIDSQNVNMVDFCSDGTGHFISVTTQGLTQYPGEAFKWDVVRSIGGRWNEPKIRFTPLDSTIGPVDFTGESFHESVLRAPRLEADVGSTHSLHNSPGILHPNEADFVFEFSDAAETTCRE